ncbi:hypothetical protein [Mycobacterium sp. 1165178.9]|uniref:hypothetical protein n=1 Tax=Mycobacterium sp. 1165178.9 TaxID=1834070 RepID=UPI000AFC4AA5|nr:hypothetical protein [Mycobacterium sp. 1165178.9]
MKVLSRPLSFAGGALDEVSGLAGGFGVEHPVVRTLQLNHQQMISSATFHALDAYWRSPALCRRPAAPLT